jgi:S1-C subfamily serine protease
MSLSHDEEPAGQPAQPSLRLDPASPDGPGNSPRGLFGRPHRHRALALAAVAMVGAVAGGGVAYAATAGPGTLTTSQIRAATNPGLVDVVTTLGYQGAKAAGTGLVLTPNGEVLTNNHVIKGATSIKAIDVGNGHTYAAKVVGYDASHDIAVIQLQHASGLKTVTLGDSTSVKVGDKVVGIGNALGRGGTPAAATGKVTALERAITASDEGSSSSEQLSGLIQTNANIQPGDSGGPLVNSHGQVIGIDTAGSSGIHLTARQATTQGFAVPINTAVSIASQIEAGTQSATVHIGGTAFLGVQLAPSGEGFDGGLPGSTSEGVTIAGVVAGSPVASAGLQAGDQITSLGGHEVTSPSQIASVLHPYHPGGKISITWVDQAGQPHSSTLVLASGPAV